MHLDPHLTLADLRPALARFWALSGEKIDRIATDYDHRAGSPVFTRAGRYTTRGWTEWTQGFEYGSAFLQYDATGEARYADYARRETVARMASHVSHIGVHDHGFNNVSTYGNWLRLMRDGRLEARPGEVDFCELALKVSGAVQAARWTPIPGGGFIHSFNGPHSLFVDTVRSVRALVVADRLGHCLMGEGDKAISLLERAVQHLRATARYSVYYGEGRDSYDECGRTAHECVFNTKDGAFRCPNSQQGYSGFTTWTRGLAWALLGFAEELEFFRTLPDSALEPLAGRADLEAVFLKAARATADWYLANTATDGIPYWDGGAPGLVHLGDWRGRPSEPHNAHEPVDSSAAAIAAQGLLRLGRFLGASAGQPGERYQQAGLGVARTLFAAPYLSEDPAHQGLLLHSVYHRPNGWDHIPPGQTVPCGESSMWGDYHARELALLLSGLVESRPYLTFFGCLPARA